MTVPRLRAIDEFWKQNPPIHLLIPAYMGYEAPKSIAPDEASGDFDLLRDMQKMMRE